MTAIQVTSEINKLEKVLVHRPGDELLNLTPNTLEELLFDDSVDVICPNCQAIILSSDEDEEDCCGCGCNCEDHDEE